MIQKNWGINTSALLFIYFIFSKYIFQILSSLLLSSSDIIISNHSKRKFVKTNQWVNGSAFPSPINIYISDKYIVSWTLHKTLRYERIQPMTSLTELGIAFSKLNYLSKAELWLSKLGLDTVISVDYTSKVYALFIYIMMMSIIIFQYPWL